jgi:hypothetical protein
MVQVRGNVDPREVYFVRGATGTPLHRRSLALRPLDTSERSREPRGGLNGGKLVDVSLRGGIAVDAQGSLPSFIHNPLRPIIVVAPHLGQAL